MTDRWGWGCAGFAIVDVLEASAMANEDGTVWIVYNGEFTTTPELRRGWSSAVTAIAPQRHGDDPGICRGGRGALRRSGSGDVRVWAVGPKDAAI